MAGEREGNEVRESPRGRGQCSPEVKEFLEWVGYYFLKWGGYKNKMKGGGKKTLFQEKLSPDGRTF